MLSLSFLFHAFLPFFLFFPRAFVSFLLVFLSFFFPFPFISYSIMSSSFPFLYFVFCIPSFCHLFYLSLFILFYESMTVDVFDFFFSSPSVHQYMKPVLIPGVAHSLKYSIIQKYNTKKIKGGVGGNSEKHTSTCMMILKCYHHSSLRNRLPQECLG